VSVRGAVAVAAGSAGPDDCEPSAVPHWLQKRIEGSLAVPQDGQTWLRTAPQPPQKREPAGFSVAQLEQIIGPL
jgi:hypothetical protein